MISSIDDNQDQIIFFQSTISHLSNLLMSASSSSMFTPKPWHSEFEHRPMRTMVQNTIFQLIFEVFIIFFKMGYKLIIFIVIFNAQQRPNSSGEWLMHLVEVAQQIEVRLYHLADSFIE